MHLLFNHRTNYFQLVEFESIKILSNYFLFLSQRLSASVRFFFFFFFFLLLKCINIKLFVFLVVFFFFFFSFFFLFFFRVFMTWPQGLLGP